MKVSVTQVNLYRQCQMAYKLRYVDGIQSKQAVIPIELGSLIHEYLELYYKQLQSSKTDSANAHSMALETVTKEWQPKLTELANTAYMIGSEETSEALLKLWSQAERIIKRYYVIHGAEDAEQHEFLYVELPLEVSIQRGLQSVGQADLITRDRNSGFIYLWEHKSAKSVPSTPYRLRDMQTALYAQKLDAILDIKIQGIAWNYLKTDPPRVPEPLKNGELSHAKIDTTWEIYLKAINDAGLDPADYEDMREKLELREPNEYFPRYTYLLQGDTSILLRDYITTAKEITQIRRDWAKGRKEPVRSVGWQCDRCFAGKLCTAAITLGGIDSVLSMHYTTREQRKAVVAAQEVVLKLPIAVEDEYEELV